MTEIVFLDEIVETTIRKANVIFNNGDTKDGIYLGCGYWEWKNDIETGKMQDPTIGSFTISISN